ncbi:hypothetical protein PInf_007532 [Phytophthora infestans]|nr:hypothetical protein PInf_007532 [Phytophthora infestans]
MGRGSYCKLYLGNTEVVEGSANAGASFSNLLAVDNGQPSTHRIFRTKVLYTDQKSCPEWNEKLELHVMDPDIEILTIRVKNQLMLFCPAIGACAIPLCNVKIGEPAEQWFPLYKQNKPAGHIRLQLLLKEKDPVLQQPPVAVNESPMQRLIQQHCQQERERRQSQQSEETIRRRQFEEHERMEMELRRQKREAEERERTVIEEMAKMQAFHEQMQREEQAKVQTYLQKQMTHEEVFHAQVLPEKMRNLKIEETPEVTKNVKYFADDVATSSTSTSSFSGLQDGSHERIPEAVEVTDVMLGEVMHDALPSDSSDEDGRSGSNARRKTGMLVRATWVERKRSEQPSVVPKSFGHKVKKEISQTRLSAHDSSSSEETSSSEEERRHRRRRHKEKKAKRKERRRRRKAKRKARREADGYDSSSSYSSSSSSPSSSSSTSSDERRKRKSRKHKKTRKERDRTVKAKRVLSLERPLRLTQAHTVQTTRTIRPTNTVNALRSTQSLSTERIVVELH